MADGKPIIVLPQVLNYKIITLFLHTTGSWKWSPCNMVDFFNQGTTNAYVNGRLIQPNAGFGFPGNPGELDQTTYNISFDDPNSSDNLLVVTTKEYINYGTR